MSARSYFCAGWACVALISTYEVLRVRSDALYLRCVLLACFFMLGAIYKRLGEVA